MKCIDFLTLIRHVTLWPWPLTPRPWMFVVLRASCVQTLYKIWAKSNYQLQSYSRFRTFSAVKFLPRPKQPNRSQGCVDQTALNLQRTEGNHFRLTSLCRNSDILLHFETRAARRSKSSDIENDAKFRTFWPPAKIRGGVDEMSGSCIVDLPMTEAREYIWFDGRPLRDCWARCIGKTRTAVINLKASD